MNGRKKERNRKIKRRRNTEKILREKRELETENGRLYINKGREREAWKGIES